MSVDDLLFIIIFGGVVLSVAHLRAQYSVRRSNRIAELRYESRVRELYGTGPNRLEPLKGSDRPVPGGAAPQFLPNAVLLRALPIHVRFVYRAPSARRQHSAETSEASG
jgi:hypothetical protein